MIVTAKNCKAGAKKIQAGEGKINCESGNSGELCGRVCAIIKQRPSWINECLMSGRDVGDVLFIIGICVLYLSLSALIVCIFDYYWSFAVRGKGETNTAISSGIDCILMREGIWGKCQ